MKTREFHLAIDANTRALGLVGQGIGYSLSPAIHNLAIEQLGKNLVYLPFDIQERSLKPFLDFFWDAGGVGFNVTTPHKSTIARMIPGHGLSSVNTVFRGETWWEATSTDAEGFSSGLERIGWPLSEFSRIVFIGAGGAVLALVEYFARHALNVKEMTVLARNPQSFPMEVLKRFPQTAVHSLGLNALAHCLAGGDDATLLIQGTNGPQNGDNLAGLVPGLREFKGTFVDLVYGQPSALYFECLNRGLPTQDGEPMLIEQARASQRLWFGQTISYEAISDILKKKRRNS